MQERGSTDLLQTFVSKMKKEEIGFPQKLMILASGLMLMGGCGQGTSLESFDSSRVASWNMSSHPGVQLIESYVIGDAAARRIRDDAWSAVADIWYDEPQWDRFAVIDGMTLERISADSSTARVGVRYHRVGYIHQRGTELADFEPDVGIEETVYTSVLNYRGWNIAAPQQMPHVAVGALLLDLRLTHEALVNLEELLQTLPMELLSVSREKSPAGRNAPVEADLLTHEGIQLIETYANADTTSRRMTWDPWFLSVSAWPDEPGWDGFVVINGMTTEPLSADSSTARVRVSYQRLGYMWNTALRAFRFVPDVGTESRVFTAVLMDEGWFLAEPQQPPHVAVRAVLEEFPILDDARTDLEKLSEGSGK